MVKTGEVLQELQTISRAIDKVMRITGFKEYGDMSRLEINEENADDNFLRNEMERIIDELADEQYRISYLLRPIVETGTIHQNGTGRYETTSGYNTPVAVVLNTSKYLKMNMSRHSGAVQG